VRVAHVSSSCGSPYFSRITWCRNGACFGADDDDDDDDDDDPCDRDRDDDEDVDGGGGR
jgi:hypothetical protein